MNGKHAVQIFPTSSIYCFILQEIGGLNFMSQFQIDCIYIEVLFSFVLIFLFETKFDLGRLLYIEASQIQENCQPLIIITFSFKPVNHNYESTFYCYDVFLKFGYISNVLYCLVNHYSLLCIRSIYCIICSKPHPFLTTNLTTAEAIAVHKISLKTFLIQILFLILLYRFLQYQNL